MENVALPDDVINSFKKFKNNYEAANKMYSELKDHKGEYVAIDNGKVKGYTETYEDALEKYGNIEGVFIELITDENILWIL
ncbi:DUF5678 domain-containing protein [Cuniculiplasma divulgatum]|jgi:hypothetical protein|uniref:Uncharacterized protein n=1 Tax=Cuniculiplasma divulgatum TaxID=1673428 RepID=A0A1R4A7W3_9ARCH|nr:DUF5678 domain-containing protein [Cuniculiplasma divulgatum]MCI2412526.1 DUF5678 domain-containing protein [Cuniculiplasma sp.]MCI2413234.1 DUF5678 domain-containing protein [Cuniculiplasma sp.]SJK85029.1 hypothetical protein CPM_1222 [Cuniculiplasma divulgatum]